MTTEYLNYRCHLDQSERSERSGEIFIGKNNGCIRFLGYVSAKKTADTPLEMTWWGHEEKAKQLTEWLKNLEALSNKCAGGKWSRWLRRDPSRR